MNVFNVHSNRSPVDGTVVERVVSRRQLRQRGARQGVARERAQRAAPAHRRRPATSRACRSPGSIARRILCYVEAGDDAGARPALRLHPLRLARGRLPRSRRDAASRGGRRRRRDRDDPRGTAPDGGAPRIVGARFVLSLSPPWPTSTPGARAAEEPGSPPRHLPAAEPVHDRRRCSPASTRSCRR